MARKRPLESGWCQAGNHRLCWHKLQEANQHRPEIWCACNCHLSNAVGCTLGMRTHEMHSEVLKNR